MAEPKNVDLEELLEEYRTELEGLDDVETLRAHETIEDVEGCHGDPDLPDELEDAELEEVLR